MNDKFKYDEKLDQPPESFDAKTLSDYFLILYFHF
jgi:hypothetical protein